MERLSSVGKPACVVLLALSVFGLLRIQAQTTRRADVEEPSRRTPVHEALLAPVDFPFAADTPLSEACAKLGRAAGVRVVIDRAALKRLKIEESVPVRLDLAGVRLKTGLKLLLDQHDLAYKIVPEDNLLVVTDAKGADDPTERLTREVKTVHEEIHDLQDAVDQILDMLEAPPEEMPEPKGDEAPAGDKPRPKAEPEPREPRSRSRPGA